MTDAIEPPGSSARSPGAGRQWRAVWRLHFYAGMFAMPFMLLMAATGLVILYTQPIQDLTDDVRTVTAPSEAQAIYSSFDEQVAAVEAAFPDATVADLTPPADASHATRVFLDDGSEAGRFAFVDPYTAEVLGTTKVDGGIVGLSNRLHGSLNNESLTVTLPTVAALWDGGAVMRDYVLGDLALELAGGWALVLVGSGLYLWLPRRSAAPASATRPRRTLFIRRGVTGRARWRDLHAVGGVVLFPLMILTIVSGLGWSTYWGPGFSSFAQEVTPGTAVDAPASPLGVRGDLDRFGNQIPWATGDYPIPASYAPDPAAGDTAAPLHLDDVVRIAQTEGMKPGYTISFPSNTVDEVGNALYGTFTLSNSWPRKTGEARDLFVDQFRGTVIDEQRVYGNGPIAYGMDTLVSTHMGTQLGLFSRILMTLLCVLSIWAVLSGFVMFWKRRRPGTLGLPRRPVDVRLTRRLGVLGVLTGIVFPQWGASALVVLGIDRFVIRRNERLRATFGQPTR